MSGKVKELKDSNFDAEISKGMVIVDFWAPWCGPCKMMAPEFEAASEEMKGKVVFAKVNVDEENELSQKYEIRSIPTLLMFKNGEIVNQAAGAMRKEDLIEIIKKAFSL